MERENGLVPLNCLALRLATENYTLKDCSSITYLAVDELAHATPVLAPHSGDRYVRYY